MVPDEKLQKLHEAEKQHGAQRPEAKTCCAEIFIQRDRVIVGMVASVNLKKQLCRLYVYTSSICRLYALDDVHM